MTRVAGVALCGGGRDDVGGGMLAQCGGPLAVARADLDEGREGGEASKRLL